MWVKFKIEGFAWVDTNAIDEDDPELDGAGSVLMHDISRAIIGDNYTSETAENVDGSVPEGFDVKCCGGANVRMIDTGSWGPGRWLLGCDKCYL